MRKLGASPSVDLPLVFVDRWIDRAAWRKDRKSKIEPDQFWQSAWKEGKGDSIPAGALGAVKEADLVRLYSDPTFIPSLTLDEFAKGPEESIGTGHGKQSPRGAKPARKKPKSA